METEVAFAVDQLSMDAWPAVIDAGIAVNERILGAGTGLTVTVTGLVAVPPGPVAVSVYIYVIPGDTETETLPGTVSAVPLMETEVAFVVDQLSTDDWPVVIDAGVAVNERMLGADTE